MRDYNDWDRPIAKAVREAMAEIRKDPGMQLQPIDKHRRMRELARLLERCVARVIARACDDEEELALLVRYARQDIRRFARQAWEERETIGRETELREMYELRGELDPYDGDKQLKVVK